MYQRWTRRLSALFLPLLTLLSTAAVFVPGQAFAANGDASTVTYQDNDHNGTIERLVIAITNGAAETWTVNGTPNIAVTMNGNAITVSSVAISGSASANPVLINVNLDTNDADLVLNTGPGSDAPNLVYTQAGGGAACTNCIRGTTAELSTIASGFAETDGATPVMVYADTRDLNGDGTVDYLVVLLSESAILTDGNAGDGFPSLTLSVSDSGTASIANANYATTGQTYEFTLTSVTPTANTAITIGATYASAAAGSIIDAAGNEMVNGEVGTGTDGARPAVVSATPAADATGVSPSTSLALTFSEAMTASFVYGTEFTMSPNPGGWSSGVWSNSNKTVTVAHANFSRGTTYTLTPSNNDITAASGSPNTLAVAGTYSTAWSFRTLTGNSTGATSSSGPVLATGVKLTSPNAGDTYVPGMPITLSWEPVGSGRIDFANLAWSADGGATWSSIATGVPGASYVWTVPDAQTDNALVRVQATDLATVIATDVSDVPFSISGTSPAVAETPKAASAFAPGSQVKAAGLSAVYYVGTDGKRHPFPNERVYKTWFPSFDGVVEASVADLSALPMGKPMLPKSGSFLVKIQSDPKTYWIEADGTVRWAKTEAVAARLMGPAWNTKVLDLDVTQFASMVFGADIE